MVRISSLPAAWQPWTPSSPRAGLRQEREARQLDVFERVRRLISPASIDQAEALARAGKLDDAQAMAAQIVQASPGDPKALACQAYVLSFSSNLQGALLLYDDLLANHVGDLSGDDLTRAGKMYMDARQTVVSANILQRAVALDPNNALAYRYLMQVMPPTLPVSSPFDPMGDDPLLRLCSALYAAGNFDGMLAAARQALVEHPGEPMAYCAISAALEAKSAGAYIPQLATQEQRSAVLAQFTAICDPAKLLVGWASLPADAQAFAAFSMLPYAKLIPSLIERHLVILLLNPTTSILAYSYAASEYDLTPDGRYLYGVRGIDSPDAPAIVAIDRLMFDMKTGAPSVITHEIAHALDFTFAAGGAGVFTPEQSAAYSQRILDTFAEARAGQNGQTVNDNYSRTNFHEYFAQGMQDYAIGGAAAFNLRKNNPHLYDLCAELVQALSVG